MLAGLLQLLAGELLRAHQFRDKVRYRLADLWLTDAELHELATEITDVVLPRLANRPGPGRSRRVLRTFLLPGAQDAAPG